MNSNISKMINKMLSHAENNGGLLSVEILVSLFFALIFWCGVWLIISGESISMAIILLLTGLFYVLFRYALHKLRKLNIPWLETDVSNRGGSTWER